MPSTSSNPVRRAPQQERSTKRLAEFLDAAAELFAEVGYEAATMTAIAERCGAGIGTLYHYFPDKQAVANALVAEYARGIETHWKPLMERMVELTPKAFASEFIARMLEFTQSRPAYLRLVVAPIKVKRDPAARRALRVFIANAYRVKNPALTEERAFLAAHVTMQIMRGLSTMYADATVKEKPAVAAEFELVLSLYLGSVLA